jgi:peptide deformylase
MIVTDEALLRLPCEDVAPEEVGPLREKLEQEFERSGAIGRPGVGLAAPQIGVAKKMAIVRAPGHSVDLVNCFIENAYDLSVFEGEGCLSFPGRHERTKRYGEVHVVGNAVEPPGFVSRGFGAIVVQHELDHLVGRLLPDYALRAPKVRPNDPCPCQSGKKYKRCCRVG